MSSELVPVETEVKAIERVSANPLDLPSDVFRAALDRRRENHRALIQWVRTALVEGVDYGKLHVVSKDKCSKGNECTNPAHFSKPSLFKPGAEKIGGMLGVVATFPTLPDYEKAAIAGADIKVILLRCELVDAGGKVVATGTGGRQVQKDYGDVNKSFKMAQKSGQIDATLRLGGLSEVFTQDIEDMVAITEKVSPAAPEEATGPSQLEGQLRRSLGETPEPVRLEGTVAPGHCTLKGCGAEIEIYKSSQDRYPGREYWMCSKAHADRDALLDTGLNHKQANGAVAAHYREWAGPWNGAGNAASDPAAELPPPLPEDAPAPSIFDPQAISAKVAKKLAKEKAAAK